MSATMDVPARANGAEQSLTDSERALTVVLADEDAPTRSNLRSALEGQGFFVVAEASDADEAVGAALRHRPGVCLLAVEMPGGGISAAGQICPQLPETKVALLAGVPGESELLDAIRAGADGYLLRATAPDGVTLALRALLRGEAVLPRALTAGLVAELRALVATSSSLPRSRLRYVPRFAHHFRRRRRSGMARSDAWRSTRVRMREYH